MGLLDDAIREHLELKRRRGGDPAEIARAEQEALGPVRREPEPAAPAVEEPHAEHHDEVPGAAHSEQLAAAHDFDDEPSRPPAPPEEQTRIIAPQEREPAHREPAAHEPPGAHEPPPAAEPPTHAEPPAAHDQPGHRHVPEQHIAAPADKLPPGSDAFDEPPHRPAVPEQHVAAPADKAPKEPPAPPEPRPSDVVDQPTTEYRVEDHHDDTPSSGDEDVLEETPDFLQETPEHDRLWFEQRPPRDFDFDD